MAWQGKILRVNLTSGAIAVEPLNQDWAQDYLGQRGLGTKYLAEEIDPTVDPLSPGNKLIIATGPLTGTSSPTGGRTSAITKGPLTNAIACSNSGGHFGAEFKMAGYDMLIVEGRAPKPVYLWIKDDHVEIRDASAHWGLTVWEVEPALRAELGEPEAKVASIAKSGEIGVKFACIVNDLDRAYGRSGVGAVMGSKNLKAMVARGTKGVRVSDPAAFLKASAAADAALQGNPMKKRFETRGTHNMMDVTNKYGSLPTRNCRDVQFEGVPRVNADAVTVKRRSDGRPSLVGNKACFACTIGCGRLATIDPESPLVQGAEKARYRNVSGGLEYENAYAFGPMCGVDDLDAVNYVNFLCNEHAMDPISMGASVAAAMDLFEEGALTPADTGGLDLRFGNADALVKAVELTAAGEGIGRDIGLGAARLCAKYGRPELAMAVKGQEFPGYDPRAMKGMALAYATSNRGACHMRARPYALDFANVGIEGRAEMVKKTQDFVSAMDSSGLCAFPNNIWDHQNVIAMLNGDLEGDWSMERFYETGERIWNLERQFNLAAGLTAADDTLPPRTMTEPAKGGAGTGEVADLSVMLPQYYALRGWTADGVPTPETLARLKLA